MKKYTDENSKAYDEIRYSIGKAIISIMRTKPFADIIVSDICNEAHVGRTTYYRYYGEKDGKINAVYFYLKYKCEKYFERHSNISLPDAEKRDTLFLNFVYSIKKEISILRRNNLSHLVDKLILHAYGPSEESSDMSYIYHVGAGIWIGVVRGIIASNFVDPPEKVLAIIRNGFNVIVNNIILESTLEEES